MASNRSIKAVEMILKTLETADNPPEEIKPEQENFDDITLFDMTKDESSISLQQAPNMSNSNFDDLVFNKLDAKKKNCENCHHLLLAFFCNFGKFLTILGCFQQIFV